MNPLEKLKQWERDLRLASDYDISKPEDRKRAMRHYNWLDHAILRIHWTNFFQIAPGVYRSNHPTHERLEDYAAMGIKSVLNLRGTARHARYLFEKESCDALGMTMVNIPLHARKAAPRENLLQVIEAFRTIDRPFMMHCKSGADRAGLASAMYLMVIEGQPVEEARKMLSVKYLHLKWSKTGVLDYMLDVYAARNARDPVGFEQWVTTEYDPEALQAGFDNGRKIPA
ncbi:fused DSP-PTPase phosphatase/NAD kinase-like protein [Thalassovita taeanensis]|uniref:Dual specificity phosphatase, catalytic domain n=1 Tax=Thalassovita taeanensis TaxID=657014 RepID=A0A1H9FFQ7_9RHOB|nr:tyrosine-protein phosphatase [Thalassovita taeanensis]SEQ36303.1 Dual specificity phosphatase, catalytic domain [Thalassovita taeanensis]